MKTPWELQYYLGLVPILLGAGGAWAYIGISGTLGWYSALMGGYMLFTLGSAAVSGIMFMFFLVMYLQKKV